ncbi:MAG: hypothetical protein NC341_01625 [Blautia sp.]|nr:hypothetical protein [Blautia sp.]MCM1201067.1 hypothetical protein [Bacteroides fragilis]
MREFMTRVSDYISERRNDPEKNGNFVVLCVIGMVILASIILCLLLLWQKNVSGEQKMKAEISAEKPEIMLAENQAGEELEQQYLMDIEYFGEKIEELSASMARVKETLETTAAVQEDNLLLREQVEEITGGITSFLTKLQNTQNTLHALNDLVKGMDAETIPVIQKQLGEIAKQMGQVDTDVAAIYGQIDALETTDSELKIKIREMQGALKTSIEQNVADITSRFESVNGQIQQMITQMEDARRQLEDTKGQVEDTKKELGNAQERIRELDTQMLRYRYDEAENTLYLYENQ